MALFVADSEVLWLNVMNATLGIVVLICCLIVVGAVVHQVTASRLQRSRAMKEVDGDMHALLGTPDDHSFDLSGLGLTMADGGERTDKEEGKKKAR